MLTLASAVVIGGSPAFCRSLLQAFAAPRQFAGPARPLENGKISIKTFRASETIVVCVGAL